MSPSRQRRAPAWAASSAGRALPMEVTSPQALLTISRTTGKEEGSCQHSSGETATAGQEQGDMQAKVAFYINWRATDARPGPKLTPGNTTPNDAGHMRPGKGTASGGQSPRLSRLIRQRGISSTIRSSAFKHCHIYIKCLRCAALPER